MPWWFVIGGGIKMKLEYLMALGQDRRYSLQRREKERLYEGERERMTTFIRWGNVMVLNFNQY